MQTRILRSRLDISYRLSLIYIPVSNCSSCKNMGRYCYLFRTVQQYRSFRNLKTTIYLFCQQIQKVYTSIQIKAQLMQQRCLYIQKLLTWLDSFWNNIKIFLKIWQQSVIRIEYSLNNIFSQCQSKNNANDFLETNFMTNKCNS